MERENVFVPKKKIALDDEDDNEEEIRRRRTTTTNTTTATTRIEITMKIASGSKKNHPKKDSSLKMAKYTRTATTATTMKTPAKRTKLIGERRGQFRFR